MVKKRNIDKSTLILIRNHLNYIRNKFSPGKIILFGSRAKGSHLKTSDIDIIIVSSKFEGINFHKRMVLAYGKWNKSIDLEAICYTPEEFKKKSKEYGIVRHAIKEGIEL